MVADSPARIVPGVAETSLARQAAARLGVSRDELSRLIDRNLSASRAPAP